MSAPRNLDEATVVGFGDEWRAFDQAKLEDGELDALFAQYFAVFPWERLGPDAVGFDLGCGSGRWAKRVAPRVGTLHCIDASRDALAVAERNLAGTGNCVLTHASVDALELPPASMDFGYSLGVLHHVPDTEAGLRACARLLRPGAPLLVYLYYAFDNRPGWFRIIWRGSDVARRAIARLPPRARYATSQVLALAVYLPLARLARLIEARGRSVERLPLSSYRDKSFYTMRTDVLDRFGTRLERRYTAEELKQLMEDAGLRNVVVSREWPYWCAVGCAGG